MPKNAAAPAAVTERVATQTRTGVKGIEKRQAEKIESRVATDDGVRFSGLDSVEELE